MVKDKELTLSLIIPAYNEENHLRACLDGVAAQSIRPDEVIVVDNNSSDKTALVAKSYPFVRVLKEQKQGVVFARDRGFDAAKCSLIGRIDADTILPVDWVERVKVFYQERSHKSAALTGGSYFYNVRLPRLSGWILGQIAFRINRLLMGHYILYGSNMALPKKLWQSARGYLCHDNDVHEDLDLAIHLHRLGYLIEYHEDLRVGVKMRRVRSSRGELWSNLMWWPQTLKKHGRWTWVFGWLGALLLYLSVPVVVGAEFLARLFGRKPLAE